MIENISAVTLATHDMRRAVQFYRLLGFQLLYGGEEAAFTVAGTDPQLLPLVYAVDGLPSGARFDARWALEPGSVWRLVVKGAFSPRLMTAAGVVGGKLVLLGGGLVATYLIFAAASMRIALRTRGCRCPISRTGLRTKRRRWPTTSGWR